MNERDALALGALLRNIGKFWQRTGLEHLSDEPHKAATPPPDRYAQWSDLFFRRHVLPRLSDADEARRLASLLQEPATSQGQDKAATPPLAQIIQDASRLAVRFD